MQKTGKVKGHSVSEKSYIYILLFVFLEEPKTTRQLVDELAEHGIERSIRMVQRAVLELQGSGFAIERRIKKGEGNEFVYQWAETPNILDNLIKAKASAFLARAA